jgi:hypothetical protein
MHSSSPDPTKFRRYRERLKAKGLRQIHLWVPDTASPRFQKELRRQLALVEASTEDWTLPTCSICSSRRRGRPGCR